MNAVARQSLDVLVIGRGAVGACAALALGGLGLGVGLVGARVDAPSHPAHDWDSRVFALSAASRRLLESVRVWHAMQGERIAPVYEMTVFPDTRAGAPPLDFSAWESEVDALAWIVEGSNLMSAIETALKFSPVHDFASDLTTIDTSDPECTSVVLADGTMVRTRLLVVADGALSPSRARLGITHSVRPYRQRAVVANFEASVSHGDRALQWFGQHGILALLPLPDARCSMVWSAASGLADELLALSPSELARRVGAASSGALGALRAITPARDFPLRLIVADRLIGPRAALVGDAAHVVHPLAGQGMNLGFGDVNDLVRVIAERESFRDPGDRAVLRRYERARAEPVALMRLATDGLQKLFDPAQMAQAPAWIRPVLGLRELGWRALNTSPWLKRHLMARAAS